MKHILIDCDPGHDDAMAILTAYANQDKLNILGITTVGGNQTLSKVTKNAQNLLGFLNAKIPLASGQEGPLIRKLQAAPEAHGEGGLDGYSFEEKEYPLTSRNAVTFLRDRILQCEEQVTIAAMGPLTNIALLLKVFPKVHSKIERIVLMGGGLSHGNCTELAEFNIYVDPEAAKIVFQSGIPLVMAGLDVTEKAVITEVEIESLRNKGRVSRMAGDLMKFYYESGKQFGFTDSPMHDLCVIAYLLEPEIFQGTYWHVEVSTENGKTRGLTYADCRLSGSQEKNVFVLEEVNRQRFVQLFLQSMEYLDTCHENTCVNK
ncbi:MAG: nucleoside hydrolase [Candidatus Ruminococcus intestinipullorum]|nr:nucleoside hydrolase [Candidatus Ruminococcus intestinipullorum]